jgi:hypothetical protein
MAISCIFLEIWRLFANFPKIPSVGFAPTFFCSQVNKFRAKKKKNYSWNHGTGKWLPIMPSKPPLESPLGQDGL